MQTNGERMHIRERPGHLTQQRKNSETIGTDKDTFGPAAGKGWTWLPETFPDALSIEVQTGASPLAERQRTGS